MRIIDWISDVCSSDLRRVGFFRCARPRLDKWLVVQLVEDDAFLADVREEVLPLADGLVHLSPAVHDEADRRLNFPVMQEARSEERRVGKECVSTFRSRWATEH